MTGKIVGVLFGKNISGYLCLCFFLMAILGKVSKMTFFDFSKIIVKYMECFSRKKHTMFFLLFLVPSFLAGVATAVNRIDDSIINIITLIITILTSMFFTLIALFIDIKEKFNANKDIDATRLGVLESLIQETYHIVMFEIMVSIMILLFCFMTIFSKKYGYIDSFIIYYTSFVLILNLFIVLNRIFSLLEEVINYEVPRC